jgi:glycosyltransferase involved in cell wall biosynthesis
MRIVVMGVAEGRGGLQTHFRRLCGFLMQEGHRVLVFAGSNGAVGGSTSGVAETFAEQRFTYQPTGTLARLFKCVEIARLGLAARRFRPDLFIAVNCGHAFVAVKRALPKVFGFYGEVVDDYPSGDSLRTAMARTFDAVAPQSQALVRAIREKVSRSIPARCLPCFHDLDAGERVARSPKADEPVRLAYFGRLADNKGLEPFLHGFAAVCRGRRARLDIHGTGPEEAALRRTIGALNLAEHVTLRGRYPEGDVYAELLCGYHGLVLPSLRCEGLPLVLLEAMSCGLPFLSTNVGAIGDCARHNADVSVVEPTEAALTAGLASFLESLRSGAILPARLKETYASYFAPEHCRNSWREMLAAPAEFFGARP